MLFGLGNEAIRDQVVEAHDASVNSVLGWIQQHAQTRMRIHGHVTRTDWFPLGEVDAMRT